jgi:hypothetical protein
MTTGTESTNAGSDMDLNSGTYSGSNSPQTEMKSYSDIMRERFQKANAMALPIIDQ